MKVTFISPYLDITAINVRILSSCLKEKRFDTQLIFLPNLNFELKSRSAVSKKIFEYDDEILEKVISICSDSDLIGITVMTYCFDGAVQITKKIKENLNIPVIWGGIHPSIRPEESLSHADIVCLGEGEEALLELVGKMEQGLNYCNVQNLWLKENGKIIKNTIRPLIQNLDELPLPDYDLNNHYVLDNNNIVKLTKETLKRVMIKCNLTLEQGNAGYQTMATRGCPHNCSYCSNKTWKELYRGQKFLRKKSIGFLIKELEIMKSQLDFITNIWFSDDSFFSYDSAEIKEFCNLYQERINLPFYCLGSPLTITEEKIQCLADVGLKTIQMGIQSGSRKTLDLYHRKISNEKVLEITGIINKFKKTIIPRYDFILDNPYETEEDLLQTLNLLLKIPKPYYLNIFSLVLYPETDLYKKARLDNLIQNETEEIYRNIYKANKNIYLTMIFKFAKNGKVPNIFLKILISRIFFQIFGKEILNTVYLFLYKIVRSLKKVRRTNW